MEVVRGAAVAQDRLPHEMHEAHEADETQRPAGSLQPRPAPADELPDSGTNGEVGPTLGPSLPVGYPRMQRAGKYGPDMASSWPLVPLSSNFR